MSITPPNLVQYSDIAKPPKYSTIVLAKTRTDAARHWMEHMEETGGLLDGILAVTHPAMYATGRTLMQNLCASNAQAHPYVDTWPSVFHALNVIVNRESIYHCDTNGLPGWYDLLASVGTYGEHAVMSFRNLGASVPYDSGSVVLISSRIVIHGVPVVPADRVCYAWLMKDSVLGYYNVPMPGWSMMEDRLAGVVELL